MKGNPDISQLWFDNQNSHTIDMDYMERLWINCRIHNIHAKTMLWGSMWENNCKLYKVREPRLVNDLNRCSTLCSSNVLHNITNCSSCSCLKANLLYTTPQKTKKVFKFQAICIQHISIFKCFDSKQATPFPIKLTATHKKPSVTSKDAINYQRV